MTRRIAIIPIVHTEADLGAVGDRLRSEVVRRGGESAWEAKQAALGVYWSRVGEAARSFAQKHAPVKLYQDGLPVCGRERAIVDELAGKGSANHALLVELIEAGAALVGTESPELLLKELELAKRVVGGEKRSDDDYRARALLERRDSFIASRIGETLGAGGAGILFIGAAHAVEPKLAGDIEIERPLQSGPGQNH